MDETELKSVSERVEELCKVILTDAHTESSQLREGAAQFVQEVLEKGDAQAKALRQKILDETWEKIHQYQDETENEMKQKSRTVWLIEREKLLDLVFDNLEARFPEVIKTEEYQLTLPEWIREAIQKLQSKEVILHLDPFSNELISDEVLMKLQAESSVKLQRGEALTDRHGVLAESTDGHRVFENTLEARLERQKPFLRPQAARLLFVEEEHE
ncbi:MAG: V-type ATP synthase subunit E [Anaerolineaceae bacterium]